MTGYISVTTKGIGMFLITNLIVCKALKKKFTCEGARSGINDVLRGLSNLLFELQRASLGISIRSSGERFEPLDDLTEQGELSRDLVSACQNSSRLEIMVDCDPGKEDGVTLWVRAFGRKKVNFSMRCVGEKRIDGIPYTFRRESYEFL